MLVISLIGAIVQMLDTIVGILTFLVIGAIALGVLYRLWGLIFSVPRRCVILPFQKGVVLRGGSVDKILEPGSHWLMPKQVLMPCDMRPKPFQVPTLALLTADGLTARISLGGEYRVNDPAAFIQESSDSFSAIYVEMKQVLHNAVAEVEGSGLAGGQSALSARMKELLVPRASQLGIEITTLNVWEATLLG